MAATSAFAGDGVRIDVADEAGVGIASVHGDVDIFSAPRLREALDYLVTAGATKVLADLSDVAFIDSTGLGVLVATHRRLLAAGGRLRVVVPPRRKVRHVFEVTGLEQVLDVSDDREDALEGWSAPPVQ